jgi:hypothetical protein
LTSGEPAEYHTVCILILEEGVRDLFRVSGVAMGILAIVVGILVLALPNLLEWIVGIGLIVVGVLAIARR